MLEGCCGGGARWREWRPWRRPASAGRWAAGPGPGLACVLCATALRTCPGAACAKATPRPSAVAAAAPPIRAESTLVRLSR